MRSTSPPRLIGKKEQVCAFIIDQIAAGLQQDEQIWTEHTYANTLGVSKSTVRKAVEELVAAGVIYQEQGRGTFVQNAGHPFVLERKRASLRLIGYVSPFSFDDRFMREISLGVEEALDGDHYFLMHKHIHIPEMTEAEVLPKLTANVQGMILLSTMTPEAHAYLAGLHEKGYPVVFIDRYPTELNCTFAVTDNVEVGRMATEHLINLGHRRILHLTHGDRVTSVNEREEGYRAAMTHAKLEPWVMSTRSHTFQDVGTIVDALLADELPTAVCCVNDGMALALCTALRERNVRVPEEISMIGVDDNPDAAQYIVPMTTIAQPKYQMGFKAAKLLMDMMAGKSRPGKGLYLQPQLIVRASTQPLL